MKTLNYILRFSLFFALGFLISGCNGCNNNDSIENEEVMVNPPPPPCWRKNVGSIRFQNTSKRGIMIQKGYFEKRIGMQRAVTITDIRAGSYRYQYEELETRKNKGGIVTIEVCPCEVTTVTLPSNSYFRCEMSP